MLSMEETKTNQTLFKLDSFINFELFTLQIFWYSDPILIYMNI